MADRYHNCFNDSNRKTQKKIYCHIPSSLKRILNIVLVPPQILQHFALQNNTLMLAGKLFIMYICIGTVLAYCCVPKLNRNQIDTNTV